MDEDIDMIKKENVTEDDLGLMLWKLESIENIYPYYKTIMEKDQE